jgi:UDP-N-acetylmuramoyl-tripeptide--D-alanyl-D-alanine ligase
MNTIKQLYQRYLQHPAISTDSRKISAGSIFFALKGPHFNGNAFAAKALQEGAAFAVIDESKYFIDSTSTILVDNVLHTLQKLALHHRRQIDLPVLAIAGSNGKTTTKELIAFVLKQRYKCHATPGNLNNYIGLPLTLLQMKPGTEIAVIELGANQQGEIASLCRLCEPTHGLITNIGKDHLEGFGGPEGVIHANMELFNYLAQNSGVAFVNADEAELSEMAKHAKLSRIISYHQSDNLDPAHPPMEMKLESENPYLAGSFLDEHKKNCFFQSKLYGTYNFNNIMTAVAVGRYFKVPATAIKKGVEDYIPSSNRSQLITQKDNLLILDAYNANPSSMNLALDSLQHLATYSQKVVVLGEMKELGIYEKQEHQAILNKVLHYQFNPALFLGEAFFQFKSAYPGFYFFKNLNDLKTFYDRLPLSKAAVLFKGSRANKLERLLESEA